MERFRQDVRLTLRSLVRSPGFTFVALLTLALGLGANTAIFSVVKAILLTPLPYADEDRLVRVYQAKPAQDLRTGTISYPDFYDWRQRARAFAALAAHQTRPLILTGRGDPFELRAAFITEDFFDVLRIPMQLGRPVVPDDIAQARPVAVMSDRLWRARFGSDRAVLGRVVTLERAYTVVGVMPPGFNYPTPDVDIWAPHTVLIEPTDVNRSRDQRILEGVARLADGVDLEQARVELNAVAAQLASEHAATNTGWNAATVVPLRTALVGDVRRALITVLVVVGIVLLIGCANVANLLLARGTGRSNEIAIRIALGAQRGRIVRQLLTESVVLSVLGGAAGVLLAFWGVGTLSVLSADTLPRLEEIRVDAAVIGFAFLLAACSGLLFGAFPAIRSALLAPQHDLKRGHGGGRPHRVQRALIVAEVGLAVVLVIAAGLMARSFLGLRSVDPGFNADRVLVLTIQHNTAGLSGSDIGTRLIQRRAQIVDRLRGLPGVIDVGSVNVLPLQEGDSGVLEFRRADGTGAADGGSLRADRWFISRGYLRAMSIPLVRGDLFPENWVPGIDPRTPILVSQRAAQRFWPDADAVGQRVRIGPREGIVLGVVGDVRHRGLATEPVPAVYLPPLPRGVTTFVVRTSGDPVALLPSVRRTIREVDPNQPIRELTTLTSVLSSSITRDRFFTFLYGAFGLLALVLAAVGVYGMLAYFVGQRREEIGVRMALGARAGHVLRLVISEGMRLVIAGVVIGGAASLALTRLLEGRLYAISTNDPTTFIVAPGILVLAALVACYFPARRATQIDPGMALRSE